MCEWHKRFLFGKIGSFLLLFPYGPQHYLARERGTAPLARGDWFSRRRVGAPKIADRSMQMRLTNYSDSSFSVGERADRIIPSGVGREIKFQESDLQIWIFKTSRKIINAQKVYR